MDGEVLGEGAGRTRPGCTVGEVARLAGTTVRTLHHWDAVGLLRPSGRTASGYRTYGPADLDRLQRILAYRELGFGLAQTAAVLDDQVDELAELRRQHALLGERRDRLDRILTTIERTMEARTMGISLTPQEMLEAFDGFDPTEHAAEAEQRWGETDAYRESARRTATYTKADWQRFRAASDDLLRRLAAAVQAGTPPDSTAGMDLAEEHREQIEAWFYACSPATHRGLGELYVADERFTATYDAHAPGLAMWLRDAIAANAERQEA